MIRASRRNVLAGAALATLLAACGHDEPRADATLTIAAYSAARDALDQRVIPAFETSYFTKTQRRVKISPSYLASGAQSRAVVAGFEADVVMLALEPDVERIEKAKLITHAWKKDATFATTLVVLAVRPGNPKGVRGFGDLARPGLEVLMPSPKTSGGAMWNVSALWGAALHGEAGVTAKDEAAAEGYLRAVLKNVPLFDKGARESMITFEKGIGDVAVTYESEIIAGRLAGRHYDEVVPRGTIVIDLPAAVVDVYADKHGTRAIAEAFVQFLHASEAQRAFGEVGFRPIDAAIAADTKLPPAEATFTIAELGGFKAVVPKLFATDGVFARAFESIGP